MPLLLSLFGQKYQYLVVIVLVLEQEYQTAGPWAGSITWKLRPEFDMFVLESVLKALVIRSPEIIYWKKIYIFFIFHGCSDLFSLAIYFLAFE